MIKRRPYWIEQIYAAWKKRPIVWVSGVRRVGKTTLAKMLKDAVYMNCDLPSVARRELPPSAPLTVPVRDARAMPARRLPPKVAVLAARGVDDLRPVPRVDQPLLHWRC